MSNSVKYRKANFSASYRELKKLISISSIVLLLTGCGTLQKPNVEMVNTSVGDSFDVIGSTASSRLTVFNSTTGRFCAEPPPETQITESSVIQALLEAANEIKSDDKEADQRLKAQVYSSYAQSLSQLYDRSHTNQLFRDASYYLCQAHLNDALTPGAAAALMQSITIFSSEKADPKSAAQLEKNISDLEKLFKNVDTSGYMLAQLYLSQLAFKSLRQEVTKFYDTETAETKGKADAIASFTDVINQAKTDINGVTNTQVETISGEISELKEDVGGNKQVLDGNHDLLNSLDDKVESLGNSEPN